MRKLFFLLAILVTFHLQAQNEFTYCEMCWANAQVNNDQSSCLIEWSSKWWEAYDDGTVENYFAWIQAGNMVAVKYPYYVWSPLHVVGGSVYVGDGSFPEGSDFIGQPFRACIYDDDGEDGLPGTLLDSITVVVDDYYWVTFEGLDVVIEEGYFYLAVEQLNVPPYSPPVGIDEELPTNYKSFIRYNGEWQASTYNDFMIRYIACDLEESPDKIEKAPAILSYSLALVKDFDTLLGEGPEDGTMVLLEPVTPGYETQYIYEDWDTLAPDYYAFAVNLTCDSEDESGWVYSNIVSRELVSTNEKLFEKQLLVYPNPFTTSTTIAYTLHQPTIIKINIYNHLGELVETINENQQTGKQKVVWEAEALPGGVYFFRMNAEGQIASGKMVLMR